MIPQLDCRNICDQPVLDFRHAVCTHLRTQHLQALLALHLSIMLATHLLGSGSSCSTAATCPTAALHQRRLYGPLVLVLVSTP